MLALFTEDQKLIQDTAEKIAAGGLERARSVAKALPITNDPTDELVAEWSGLGVSEGVGGHGGSLVDVALLIYALARQCDPGGYVAHAAAVQACVGAGLELSEVAGDGERLALMSAKTSEAAPGLKRASRAAVLSDQGVSLHTVVSVADYVGLDTAREWGQAQLGDLMASGAQAELAEARALVVASADLCGTAQGAIDVAVDYASQRHQFGKPIGSYQAIGHRLAQAKGDLEAAWSLTLYACWAADNAPEEALGAALAAKAMAGDVAVFAAESCIQTHGGMGITIEADPHLYLKRALTTDIWIASASACRQRLARIALQA
jgi:alkylation response protein AidB-like acyl-CoA dehydrogenase